MQMFSSKSSGFVFTGYVKSGALVNRKFHEFLVPTFLMSMSAQLGVVFDGIIVSYLLSAGAMASVGASMSLNQIAAIDPENHIAQSAQKLMQKIIKHGRTFPHDDMKLVSIYFYDNA